MARHSRFAGIDSERGNEGYCRPTTAVPLLPSHLGVKESVARILHLRGGALELDRRWSFFLKEK